MTLVVWRLVLLVLLVPVCCTVIEAFAFTALPSLSSSSGAAAAESGPSAHARASVHQIAYSARSSPRYAGEVASALAPAVRPLCPSGRAAAAGRAGWARSARIGANGGDDNDDNNTIDVLTGSGLRGVDTSKLSGNDKRDADWFQRTADREARGQLQWFEDPAVYIGLCLFVPVVILAWGLVNCYIPGYCPSLF